MSTASDSMKDDLHQLHTWLVQYTKKGPVAVITGKNGDMDTVGSAVALAATHPNMLACGLHIGRVASRYVAKHQPPFRVMLKAAPSWPKQLAAAVVVDKLALHFQTSRCALSITTPPMHGSWVWMICNSNGTSAPRRKWLRATLSTTFRRP